MTINITDLFASAIPDLAAQDAQQGQFLAENINKLGAGYAMGLPAINRQMQRGVGRIFANTAQGMGMSPEAVQRAGAMPLGEEDRLKQLLDNSDFTTPEGKRLTIEKMKQQGFGTQALQMQTALQEQARQQQETNARSATAAAQRVSSNASLINAQVNAYMANNPGANPQNFKVADGRIYDTAKGEWINPPSGFTKPELEKIDPDAYDTNSVVRFRQALTKATTQDEIDAAGELLLPKPDNSDYKWVKNQEEDGPEYRQSVIQGSSTWSDTVSEVRTANQANRTIRERSERIVETMDRMTESVENEEAATGIKGVVLSVLPGSGNYRLSGDLETILANMGYNALQEARQNSSNGSSGFGQLTERELSRLEALIANLNQDVGVGKEAFLQRMNEIRQTFVDSGKRAKTDWTVDQWLTLENVGEPEQEVETIVVDY